MSERIKSLVYEEFKKLILYDLLLIITKCSLIMNFCIPVPYKFINNCLLEALFLSSALKYKITTLAKPNGKNTSWDFFMTIAMKIMQVLHKLNWVYKIDLIPMQNYNNNKLFLFFCKTL